MKTKKATKRHAAKKVAHEAEVTIEAAVIAPTATPDSELTLRFKAPANVHELDTASILAAMQPIAQQRGTAASKVAARVVRFLRIHAKHPYARRGQAGILALAEQAIATIEAELTAQATEERS